MIEFLICCCSVLWVCPDVRLCSLLHRTAGLPCRLEQQESHGSLWSGVGRIHPGSVSAGGRVLDGGGWHCLHSPGLVSHRVCLQEPQEQQDPVQETRRRQVHLCSMNLILVQEKVVNNRNNGLRSVTKNLFSFTSYDSNNTGD